MELTTVVSVGSILRLHTVSSRVLLCPRRSFCHSDECATPHARESLVSQRERKKYGEMMQPQAHM